MKQEEDASDIFFYKIIDENFKGMALSVGEAKNMQMKIREVLGMKESIGQFYSHTGAQKVTVDTCAEGLVLRKV